MCSTVGVLSTVGVFSTVGDIMIHVEGYLEYRGGVQYRGDIMIHVEGYLEYRGGVQYRGGYHDARGGIFSKSVIDIRTRLVVTVEPEIKWMPNSDSASKLMPKCKILGQYDLPNYSYSCLKIAVF